MSDAFDFDDDDDFDLDDEIEDGFGDELADSQLGDSADLGESDGEYADSADVRAVTDSQIEEQAAARTPADYDPYAPVPFFKNWAWWTSLIAAIPGAVLAASIVLGMKDYGGQFNWMMWTVAGLTFFLAAAAAVLPLLLALGFFLGGEEVVTSTPTRAMEDDVVPTSEDDEDDEDGYDSSVFEEDDDEDELFDEDDFSDVHSGVYEQE